MIDWLLRYPGSAALRSAIHFPSLHFKDGRKQKASLAWECVGVRFDGVLPSSGALPESGLAG